MKDLLTETEYRNTIAGLEEDKLANQSELKKLNNYAEEIQLFRHEASRMFEDMADMRHSNRKKLSDLKQQHDQGEFLSKRELNQIEEQIYDLQKQNHQYDTKIEEAQQLLNRRRNQQ